MHGPLDKLTVTSSVSSLSIKSARKPEFVGYTTPVDGTGSKGAGVIRAPERLIWIWAQTTMSNPHLPAELLDCIVDFLHDSKTALRNCCLVSKQWIPRTRRHLFSDVRFDTEKMLESWKEMFPDPSTSPGHYARILWVDYFEVTAADAEAGGWIRGFSRVVYLRMVTLKEGTSARRRALLLFHEFSSSNPSCPNV